MSSFVAKTTAHHKSRTCPCMIPDSWRSYKVAKRVYSYIMITLARSYSSSFRNNPIFFIISYRNMILRQHDQFSLSIFSYKNYTSSRVANVCTDSTISTDKYYNSCASAILRIDQFILTKFSVQFLANLIEHILIIL